MAVFRIHDAWKTFDDPGSFGIPCIDASDIIDALTSM